MIIVSPIPDDQHRGPPGHRAHLIAGKCLQRPAIVGVSVQGDGFSGSGEVDRLHQIKLREVFRHLAYLGYENE